MVAWGPISFISRHRAGGGAERLLGQQLHRGCAGRELSIVIERGQRQQGFCLCVADGAAAFERSLDEPVGEIGVLGERGTVQVGTDQVAMQAAF